MGTYKIFYGLTYSNIAGFRLESVPDALRLSENVSVNSMTDVYRIPVTFNLLTAINDYSVQFADSSTHVIEVNRVFYKKPNILNF